MIGSDKCSQNELLPALNGQQTDVWDLADFPRETDKFVLKSDHSDRERCHSSGQQQWQLEQLRGQLDEKEGTMRSYEMVRSGTANYSVKLEMAGGCWKQEKHLL